MFLDNTQIVLCYNTENYISYMLWRTLCVLHNDADEEHSFVVRREAPHNKADRTDTPARGVLLIRIVRLQSAKEEVMG
jgi:hypothetical protein